MKRRNAAAGKRQTTVTPDPACPEVAEVGIINYISCEHCGGNHVGIEPAMTEDAIHEYIEAGGDRDDLTTQLVWCMNCRVLLGGRSG